MKSTLLFSALLAGAPLTARAAVVFSEIQINPATGADNGQEFIELLSTTGGVETLNNVWILIIEGGGSGRGTVDHAYNLSGSATGPNGLWLQRDSAAALSPAGDPATVTVTADFAQLSPSLGNDIENGTDTFLLVTGYTGGAAQLDLDTNNDGVLDSTPWTSVLDGISVIEAGLLTEAQYAAQLGFYDFPDLGFTPDALVREAGGQWVGADIDGPTGGPYFNDPAEAVLQNGASATTSFVLTPGSPNPAVVPEPAGASLAALAGAGLMLRRRRSRSQA